MLTKTIVPVSLILLCICQAGNAQEKTILLDTLTFTAPIALPFDEPFFLGIPVKSADVSTSGYVHLKRNGEFDKKQGVVTLVPNVKKLGTQFYNFVEITDPYLLDPGQRYAFFWTDDIGGMLDAFDNYNDYKEHNTASSFDSAKKIILSIAKANFSKIKTVVNFDPADTMLRAFDLIYYSDLQSDFPAKYRNYVDKLSAYNSIPLTNFATQTRNSTQISLITKYMLQESKEFDSEVKDKMFKDFRLAVYRLNRLLNMTDSEYLLIKKGFISLDCDTCKPQNEKEYDNRTKNLDNTIASLHELYLTASSLHLQDSLKTVNLLSALEKDIKVAKVNLKVVADARTAIITSIKDIKGLSKFNVVKGSSVIATFDARTKLSISPDFGIVTTRIFDKKANPYPFIPYLGFHVNFRPLNRDIPFHSYHHKLISYFSAFAGWSLVNISNGPTMTNKADSINGFFNSDKGTLMTGIGIRLGNFVRITTGGIYYFKFTEKSSNPLTYERKLKAWPFLGLSLDIALKDLLNGITDVFSGVPKTYNPPVNSQINQ